MPGDNFEQGAFQGQVLARLKSIEDGQTAIWIEVKTARANQDREISELKGEVQRIKGAVALGKVLWGFMTAVIGGILVQIFKRP